MAPSPSIYKPLEPGVKTIRLLELLPGAFENDLRCSLRTVALDDKPFYEALSYTWGAWDEGRTLKIRPENQWMSRSTEIPITNNLFRALRRLRRLLTIRVLWVDAVCINQDDLDERSAQVAFMADIYASATSTVIWLGEVEGPNIHDEELTPAGKKWQLASSLVPLSLLWNGACIPMDHAILTTTPSWHTRGWIIQEYILSRRPYLQYGSKTRMIGEPSPHGAGHMAEAIPDSGFVLEKKMFFSGLGALALRLQQCDKIRIDMNRGKVISLYHAVLAIEDSTTTTDPRDKVYSLLGFVNPIERSLLYPDYVASTEFVYSKATYAALKGPTKFAMLELIKFNKSGASTALPTWAYDMTTPSPYSRHDLEDDLTKSAVPSIEINAECTELRFEGVCADIVAESTNMILDGDHCSEHDDHNSDTEACLAAEPARQVIDLLRRTKRSIRRNEALKAADQMNSSNNNNDIEGTDAVDDLPEDFPLHHIFAPNENGYINDNRVVSNLFDNWDAVAAHIGIPRTNKTPPAISNNEGTTTTTTTNNKPDVGLRPIYQQTRIYCSQASGSIAVFTTLSGNLGLAPATLQKGDRLVLPLCTANSGEMVAQVTPFTQPLALVLRRLGGKEDEEEKGGTGKTGGDGERWTFHGLAHLDGLGDQDTYIRHRREYILR